MINVSNDFKTEVKKSAKQIKAYIKDQETYPTELTEVDGLKSIVITQETSLLHTVMRQVDIKHFGTHNFLDQYINVGLGVVLPDTSTEYIDYGSFKIIERKIEKDKDYTTLKGYDKMIESLIKWDLDPIYDITYPATVKELLEAICTRLGWTLKSTTFPHHDTEIEGDEFTGVVETYRDVLEMIAEVTGSIIYFDVDDELVVAQVSHDTPLDTLSADDLNTLDIKAKWGEINSVVLSRTPAEDNILQKDQTSIDLNGLFEIKIENNLIVDSNREGWISPIFAELNGLEFYPFSADLAGLGYFQLGDRITLEDLEENQFGTVILGIKTSLIDGGFMESYFTGIPDKTSTKYQYAGVIGQRIKNTEIIVDKQKGEIILVNQALNDSIAQISITTDTITQTVNTIASQVDVNNDNIADIIEDVTQLQIQADGLEIAVSGIGGTNLLKNSVGLKGDIKEWQELDGNGDPVDARNDGTIDNTSNVDINTESGSAIQLQDEFIKQTFPTIQGETYTFYCRYKSNADALLTITGTTDTTMPSTSSDWTTFKKQFVAAGNSATLRIENSTGQSIHVSDNVVKLGDVSGWIQAPNEVYGANFRFDKDGFEITSLTDDFKSVLDNQKLAVYDTAQDKIVMLVSKDEGKVTKLTAQEEFVVQRYENPDAGARFIPVSDGLMLVINDN